MKKSGFERVLVVTALCLACIALVATLVSLPRACSGSGKGGSREDAVMRQGGSGEALGEISPFGRFRVTLSGADAPLLVADIVLKAPAADKALMEEIDGKAEALARALEAGVNLILLYDRYEPAEMIDLVEGLVRSGRISEETLDGNLMRILSVKEAYGLLR